MSPLKTLAASVAITTTVLATTGAFASALQRRAASVSREQAPYFPPPSIRDIPQATLVSQGHQLYRNSCAHCHGDDARGDEGPDLHGLEVSDRRIAAVITRGIKGEMPSFAKKHSATDVAALIAYVRSLD